MGGQRRRVEEHPQVDRAGRERGHQRRAAIGQHVGGSQLGGPGEDEGREPDGGLATQALDRRRRPGDQPEGDHADQHRHDGGGAGPDLVDVHARHHDVRAPSPPARKGDRAWCRGRGSRVEPLAVDTALEAGAPGRTTAPPSEDPEDLLDVHSR